MFWDHVHFTHMCSAATGMLLIQLAAAVALTLVSVVVADECADLNRLSSTKTYHCYIY